MGTRTCAVIAVSALLLALTAADQASNEITDGRCDRDGGIECTQIKCPSNKVVQLEDILDMPDVPEDTMKIFFIESSGRATLSPRQTCSLDSALNAMEQGSSPFVAVMAMTSPTLELSNNVTCHLYHKHINSGNLRFVYINKERIFAGTPLESVYQSGQIESSQYKIVQYSDALRLILIHRFGGWYSDIDMVFLKPLDPSVRNVISGDHMEHTGMTENPYLIGQHVNNAIFHFDRGHTFLQLCLRLFAKRYDPENRLSGGPHLLSFALKIACQVPQAAPIDVRTFTAEKCSGVSVVPQWIFYPIGWFNSSRLYDLLLTNEDWEKLFSNSTAVHMYNSQASQKKILRPKYYGAKVPGYLHLALRMCPMSFYSESRF